MPIVRKLKRLQQYFYSQVMLHLFSYIHGSLLFLKVKLCQISFYLSTQVVFYSLKFCQISFCPPRYFSSQKNHASAFLVFLHRLVRGPKSSQNVCCCCKSAIMSLQNRTNVSQVNESSRCEVKNRRETFRCRHFDIITSGQCYKPHMDVK